MTRFIGIALLCSAFVVGTTPPAAAQRKHPAEEQGLKSLESRIATSIRFVNRSKNAVHIYWIDYKGKRDRKAKLQPGEDFETDTFVTHPWLVTDQDEKVWAVYLPDAQERTVEITGPLLRPVTPTSAYHKRTIEGFTILIHPHVLAHAKFAADALEELDRQLKAISATVPAKPLERLRKVRIWLEWDSAGRAAAQFYPPDAVVWLRLRFAGLNADKVGCVDINNARRFVDWSRQAQPCIVMHELAHAYHFLALGAGHSGIREAYQQAVERKLYESVPYFDGSKRKAYALTNDKEYFAELTEAYFGKNDFFPFTRCELKKHDPIGYRLLQDVWGEPRGPGATQPVKGDPAPVKTPSGKTRKSEK